MILSLSAAVLLGVLVAILVRAGRLATFDAALCALFGFFLTSTGLAPAINDLVNGLAGVLSRWNP